MRKSQITRFENAKIHFNGMKNEKEALFLLRDCVKSILDETHAKREKKPQKKLKPPPKRSVTE